MQGVYAQRNGVIDRKKKNKGKTTGIKCIPTMQARRSWDQKKNSNRNGGEPWVFITIPNTKKGTVDDPQSKS